MYVHHDECNILTIWARSAENEKLFIYKLLFFKKILWKSNRHLLSENHFIHQAQLHACILKVMHA